MQSSAATVAEYLASLPADRREAVERIREVFLANIDASLREGMQYGMIGYFVPHEVYPQGYHCDARQPLPFAAIASQKQYLSVYLCAMYAPGGDPRTGASIRDRFLSANPRLDIGKSCIRFKRLAELPLDALAQAIQDVNGADYLRQYQSLRAAMETTRPMRHSAGAKTSRSPAKGAKKAARTAAKPSAGKPKVATNGRSRPAATKPTAKKTAKKTAPKTPKPTPRRSGTPRSGA